MICNICINLHKIINVILHIPHYVPFMSIFIFHCCFVSSWNFKDYVLYHISYIYIYIISLCNIQFSIISNNLNGFLADLDHIPISSCFFVVCSSNYCNSYIYILQFSFTLPHLAHTIILSYYHTSIFSDWQKLCPLPNVCCQGQLPSSSSSSCLCGALGEGCQQHMIYESWSK